MDTVGTQCNGVSQLETKSPKLIPMLALAEGQDRLIGFKEAADRCSVSLNTVRNWTAHGYHGGPPLEYVKVGSRVLTSISAINRFLAFYQQKPVPPPSSRELEAVYRNHPDLRPKSA